MRIDRATFLALALGGSFLASGCGTTGPVAAPTHNSDDIQPTEEGYGMDAPQIEPTYECIEWDPTDECVSWEEVPGDPAFGAE